jgi:4-hydroxy-tetrahydrodipicolinate synthase
VSRSTDVRGLIPVLATPFHTDGSLDLDSLRRLVGFAVSSDVDGVAVFGFASEGFTLTAAERLAILGVVRAELGPELPIVAGISATGTGDAIAQSLAAVEAGASVGMVIPPFMVKPSPAQIVDFYGAVAATGLPVMVQDAPASTGVNLPVPLIVELSKLDGVDSVKVETQPTAPKLGAVIAATAEEFLVLGGQNALFVLEEYARGAVGTMPASEFPDLLGPVLRDFAAGAVREARAGFNRLLPLIRFGLQPGIAWSVHKHVLRHRGIIASTTVRAPAVDADQATLTALALILEDLGMQERRL